MAYYAALTWVLQSLEEISQRDRYPKFLLDKQKLAPVYEKLSHLKALLEDYSPKDEEAADCLEKRIRDAVYQLQYVLESQDIIEYKISNLIPSKGKTHRVKTALPRLLVSDLRRAMALQREEIEKVKEEFDSRGAVYQILEDILESQDMIEYNISNLIPSKGKTDRVKTVLPPRLISMLNRAMARRHQDIEKVKQEVDSRDAASQLLQDVPESQDMIEYKISNLIPSKGKADRVKTVLPRRLISKLKRAMARQRQGIEKVKEEVDSRDAAYQLLQDVLESQDMIEYKISNLIPSKGKTRRVKTVLRRHLISKLKREMAGQIEKLKRAIEKVKEEVDSRGAVYQIMQDVLESQGIFEHKISNLIPSKGKTHRVTTVLLRLLISKLKRAMARQRQDIEKVKEEVGSRDADEILQYVLESQDINECKISYLILSIGKTHRVKTVLPGLLISKLKKVMPQQLQDIEKVKEEVDSIVEEVKRMKIKKSLTVEELELTKEEVDSIVEEVTRMKIKESHTAEELEPTNCHSASEQKQTSCGDNMVGFDEQRSTILDKLYGGSSKLEVIPLVGMGGIGKTTLAGSIFDDKLIASQFDCRAWVTVSQNYHLRKLLLDILGSLKVDTKNLSGVEECLLKEQIYKHLKWRRYLIILDDIWDTNVWDAVKVILPDDSNGSRIILTTRESNVAVYATTRENLHQMQFLSEKQSWNLLREKVFAQGSCPGELEDIGKLIAQNCRGLPLAIVVVAGLLSKVNKARYDWEKIASNVISATTANDEYLSKIFSFSYNQLPHHLKPCFLYMGGFPEDYKISISMLIKLWVAEGFLKPDESKSLEDKGEEYLEDLVKRNLVLITKNKSNRKFKSCCIHDVLRDLCVKRARHESFLHLMDNDDNFCTKGKRNNIRRLYIHPGRSQFIKAQEFGSHIGSILHFGDISKLLSFVPKFRILKTLNAREVRFPSFPAEVLELYHLRYLAFGLRKNGKVKIPHLISELVNLQTLIVASHVELPTEIWKLPYLRHVITLLVELAPSIPLACILENLQTLSRVVNFKLANEAIQMIPNLKKLKLMYDTQECSEAWEKYCLYNLVRLCQLEKLFFGFKISSFSKENSIPRNFAFPQKLKELSLRHCQIPWKDMTVVGSLPDLQVLELLPFSFVGDEWEPIEGEFPRLKFLLMHMLDLKHWRAEKTHFPCLERLRISRVSLEDGIPLEIGDIPTLEWIGVYGCNPATYISASQIKEEQQNLGNYILRVRTDERQSGRH